MEHLSSSENALEFLPSAKYLLLANIAALKPYQGVRNIYVKGLDEPFENARPVTADSRPVPGYFWSLDRR
jgi:hypothetical protein